MGVTYAMEMTARNCNIVTMADEVIMAWSKVAVHGSYLVSFIRGHCPPVDIFCLIVSG